MKVSSWDVGAVAAGAALGSIARHSVAILVVLHAGLAAMWATLLVNVAGSFAIGVAAGVAARGGLSRRAWLFVGAGFCGGFTTFSILSLETILLASEGHLSTAAMNVALSAALALIAVTIGYRAVRMGHRQVP
jgi:fluoride exporter